MFGEGVGRAGSNLNAVAELEPGWEEVVGTAETGQEGSLQAPFSGDDAVLSHNEVVWKYRDTGGQGSSTWEHSWATVESVPFYLRDETGSVRAEFDDPARYEFAAETYEEKTPGIEEWAARQDFEDRRPRNVVSTRYEEGVVEPGDEVYVFGEVVETDSEGEGDDLVVTAGDPDAMRAVVSTEGRKSPSVSAFSGSLLGGVLAVGATLLGLGLSLVGLFLALVGAAGLVGG